MTFGFLPTPCFLGSAQRLGAGWARLAVLQGSLGPGMPQVLQAIIIASASNNLLKMAYTYMFGSRRTANLAAKGLVPLAVLSMVYAMLAI